MSLIETNNKTKQQEANLETSSKHARSLFYTAVMCSLLTLTMLRFQLEDNHQIFPASALFCVRMMDDEYGSKR